MKKANQTQCDYSKKDIINAITSIGIEEGDSVLIHSNIGFFGCLMEAKNPEDYYKVFKKAIFDVVGDKGTLVVPTFSYSFCKGEVFDREKTPGICGLFSEMVRKDPDSVRSEDPNFSMVALGKHVYHLTRNLSEQSFGKDSFSDRFMDIGGKICNFNLNSASVIVHYAEKILNVPYRYDKMFTGTVVVGGSSSERRSVYFVRDLDSPESVPDFRKFHKKAKEQGISKKVDLGRGQIVYITAENTFNLIEKEIKKDLYFLTKGKNSREQQGE